MSKLTLKDNILFLSDKVVIATIPDLIKEWEREFVKQDVTQIDISNVTAIDGAGVSFIEEILETKSLARDVIVNGNSSIRS